MALAPRIAVRIGASILNSHSLLAGNVLPERQPPYNISGDQANQGISRGANAEPPIGITHLRHSSRRHHSPILGRFPYIEGKGDEFRGVRSGH